MDCVLRAVETHRTYNCSTEASSLHNKEALLAVVIYTKPGCPYCVAAKNQLEAQGVQYEEIDVTTSADAMRKLAELTYGALKVPVIVEADGDVRVAVGGG